MAAGVSLHGSHVTSRESTPEHKREKCLDDIEWDEGGIGEWYKQDYHHDNKSSKSDSELPSKYINRTHNFEEVKVNSCHGSYESSVVISANEPTEGNITDLNELWDGQYDFCVKESPKIRRREPYCIRSCEIKHSSKSIKEVFNSSKKFVKHKFGTCKKKIISRMKGGSSKRPHKRSNSSIPDSLEETESSCCNDDRQSDSEVGGKLRRKQTPNGTPKDSESDTSTVENNPNVGTDTESTPGAKDDGIIKSAEGATEGEMNMNVETAPVEIPVVEQNGVVSGVTELHHGPKDVTQEVDECNNNGPKILVRTDTDEQNDDQQPEKSEEDPIKTVDVEIKAATEDDIPLGLEADSLNTEKGIDYEKYPPVDKRLGWLIGNSENVSFTSDQSQLTNTSTSSDISLDMLLQERSADPEEILTSLGFGGSEETDPTIQRVPNRFLSQPSAADGIDLTSLLDDNNELRKLLELSENGDLMEQINLSQQNTSMMNQGHPHLGNMLASVMNGMKFLSAINHTHPMNMSLDSNSGRDREESIMQHPKNREFLEKQGFYSKFSNSVSPKKEPEKEEIKAKSAAKLMKSKSVDASERRKRFQSMKSKNFTRSIADSDLSSTSEMSKSFENGSQIKSFGQSCDMSDSCDSVDGHIIAEQEEDLEVFRCDDNDMGQRASVSLGEISHGLMSKVRYSAESTFDEQGSDEDKTSPSYRTKAYGDGLKKMRELRESQVERHMSLLDHEEDYVISPPLSKQSSFEATLTQQDLRNRKEAEGISSEVKKLGNSPKSVTFSETELGEIESEIIPENSGGELNSVFKNDDKARKGSDSDISENSNTVTVQEEEDICKMISVSTTTTQNVDTENRIIHSDNRLYPERKTGLTHVLSMEEKDSLGGMGRMESIQSDSSGFADGDLITDHNLLDSQERISSLGSSIESDSTFRSSITVLANPDTPTSPRPRNSVEFPISAILNKSSRKNSNGRRSSQGGKVDVAVSTEDLNLLEETNYAKEKSAIHNSTPSITYHLHQKEADDSGNDTAENRSVILTIELPNDWLKDSDKESVPKSSIVSHLYKYIGEPASTSNPPPEQSQNDTNKTSNKNRSENLNLHKPRVHGSLRGDNHGRHTASVHPNWASTPCVNAIKKQSHKMAECSSRNRPPKKTLFNYGEGFRPLSPRQFSSVSDFRFTRSGSEDNRSESGQSSHTSFNNEMDSSVLSMGESFSSLQDENIEYVKLLRLVNKPFSSKSEPYRRQTPVCYKPKHNIKSWSHLDRQQFMEEETRLMQQALQRYKGELSAMETVFHVNSQLAGNELTLDEREDIEELQHIWSEVQKEISETEQLLANRLGGLVMGNDNFNPLMALEIIHKMTDLIREQLFQHQVSLDKDEEMAANDATPLQWYPGIMPQQFDYPQNISRPHSVNGDSSLHESLTELRDSILHEVKQELHESTQWLHRELQGKDRELNRLRMELMTSSIKTGATRRKHYYESDV